MNTIELCANQLDALRPTDIFFSDLNMIIMLIMMVVVKVMVISISDTSMRMHGVSLSVKLEVRLG